MLIVMLWDSLSEMNTGTMQLSGWVGGWIQHCPLVSKQDWCLNPCQLLLEFPSGFLSKHSPGLVLLNISVPEGIGLLIMAGLPYFKIHHYIFVSDVWRRERTISQPTKGDSRRWFGRSKYFLSNFVFGAAFEPRSVFSRVIQPCNQAAASCQVF